MDNLGVSHWHLRKESSAKHETRVPPPCGPANTDWAALSSLPQHCCHLLQLRQQLQPLQSTAVLYIYCQAVSLAWFSLFRFLDCFGFVTCFHCLGFFLKFCFQEITNFSKFLKARAGDAIPARCLAFNLNPHGHSTLNTLLSRYILRSTTAEKHEEGQCHVTKRNNSQKYLFLLVEQDIPGQTNFSL